MKIPPHAERIVASDWDLNGSGAFADTDTVEPAERVALTRTLRVGPEDTTFVTARVVSQGEGDPSSPCARMLNVARVRVVSSTRTA